MKGTFTKMSRQTQDTATVNVNAKERKKVNRQVFPYEMIKYAINPQILEREAVPRFLCCTMECLASL